jgi:hypothetical protein
MNKTRLISMLVSSVTVLALLSLAVLDTSTVWAAGARQISGIGSYPSSDECTEVASLGATYVVKMEGDLVGCHYVFVTSSRCSPSGTYVEEGNEYFVSAANPNDTFRTRYKFEAKFRDCSTLTGEIFGRCQHPIIVGSGKGIFEGVTGRLDFKDDVTVGNFPYTGHLQY